MTAVTAVAMRPAPRIAHSAGVRVPVTHRFFRVAHSRDDLVGQRDAIAAWARLSYGWMGRSPDYKASLMNALGANAPFYERFADNARSWYARSQNHVLFMNHAIVNPPVDRM